MPPQRQLGRGPPRQHPPRDDRANQPEPSPPREESVTSEVGPPESSSPVQEATVNLHPPSIVALPPHSVAAKRTPPPQPSLESFQALLAACNAIATQAQAQGGQVPSVVPPPPVVCPPPVLTSLVLADVSIVKKNERGDSVGQ